MPQKVKVFTKSHCPYCVRAKALLSKRGISFEEVDLEEKPDEVEALKERTGWRTFPQIFFDEKLIGGFQELNELDKQSGLQNL